MKEAKCDSDHRNRDFAAILTVGVLFLSVPKEKGTKKKGTRGRCPRDPFFIVQICGAQAEKRCLSIGESTGKENCLPRNRKMQETGADPFSLYRLVALNRKGGECLLGVVRILSA